jgi:hypothetical protein
MAALTTLHADQAALSERLGGTYRRSGDYGILTNATVAAADTVTGLSTAVETANVHADFQPAKVNIQRAINYGSYDGELTNARVLPSTTVEGLVGLTVVTNDQYRDLIIN